MKIKIIIILVAISSIVLLTFVLQSKSEVACFWLAENGEAEICYEKPRHFNNEARIKNTFTDFIEAIQGSNGSMNNLVYFSEELEQKYGESALEKVKDRYSWLKENSLVYIIEGEKFSALLLEKGSEDNYVLFLNTDVSKVYFSFDRVEEYEPIVVGWVNRLYVGGMHIGVNNSWDENSQCLFRRANVILYSEKLNTDSNGDITCDFGKYQLAKKKGKTHVTRSKPVVDENVMDITMKFFYWIAG
ncbi:MAG: hypothetical protein GY820_40830 [Gammaproteobacteria bacterium]|nr:hypothetical protein [Gammaproteobacteria bacterium]